MPRAKPGDERTVAPLPGDDELEMLLQNMEGMDIEHLVNSFKVNCKDMSKRSTLIISSRREIQRFRSW